jgi:hypothetical protein
VVQVVEHHLEAQSPDFKSQSHQNENINKFLINLKKQARCQWLTLVILATWEAKIGRIKVQGQPRQIVLKTPSPK